MAPFSGTFHQSFDIKNRVSVPAAFRLTLRQGSARAVALAATTEGAIPVPLVLRPSEKSNSIECWTEDRFNALQVELDRLDPLSEEYDALATVLFGDAYPIDTDREGRILIPEALAAHANIAREPGARVVFLGMGTRFQLWDPAAIESRKITMLAINGARIAAERARAAAP